jgi:hypothetical protein
MQEGRDTDWDGGPSIASCLVFGGHVAHCGGGGYTIFLFVIYVFRFRFEVFSALFTETYGEPILFFWSKMHS